MTHSTTRQRIVATLKIIVTIQVIALLWVFAQLLGLLAKLKGY